MDANSLLQLVLRPKDSEGADATEKRAEFLAILGGQPARGRVALYASASNSSSSILIHSVLVNQAALKGSLQGIADWEGNPYDSPSCSLVSGGAQAAQVEMFGTWEGRQPEPLRGAVQLVFARTFEARLGDRTYFELSQELTLRHGLHWLEERQAWCRFDDGGEVVPLAGVERAGNEDHGPSALLVWMDADILQRHMSASGTSVVQMFDATPAPSGLVKAGQPADEEVGDLQTGLIFRYGIGGVSSYARGVHIIAANHTAQERGELETAVDDAPKEYETFIIQDWKNDRIVECSCAPDAMASYFERDSTLPFQTSPVFFRADVLDRYKSDPDKYQLQHRSITCRNAWSLQSYDVNAAGQVHTYIRYLGYLPLAEQRYWKAFNEVPKGAISSRSFKTDFEGSWDVEPDSMDALKATLDSLWRASPPWFQLKQPDLLQQLHYPLTASNKIWDDTLIAMAKAVTEGLVKDKLKEIAVAGGRSGDPAMGSIKWLKEALIAKGTDEDRATELVAPLGELQYVRTKLSAHAGGAGAAKIRQELLRKHGTPRQHIDSLAERLRSSLKDSAEILAR